MTITTDVLDLTAAFGLDETWRLQAACRSADPRLFAPVEEGERFKHYPPRAVEAASYCHQCPVFDTCKAYADARHEQGVWAGAFRTGAYESNRKVFPIPSTLPLRRR